MVLLILVLYAENQNLYTPTAVCDLRASSTLLKYQVFSRLQLVPFVE